MPTITPQVRASQGSNLGEFQHPRKTVTQSTGMDMPSISKGKEAAPAAPATPATGQKTIGEETPARAVTLSPEQTALARKQQKFQAELQAFKDEKAQFERMKAESAPKPDFQAKLQQNAAEALKELGTDYETLTRLLLEQSNGADPVKELRAEVDRLKASQDENVNKQYDATIKQYKAEATALVSKDPKKYFLIDKEQAHDAVVQHIVDTWEDDPDQVLTVEDAANEIEEYLREEAKKKKALLEELEGPPAEEKTQPPEKTLPPPRAAAKTLTSQVEATPTRQPHNQFQHLSMKERIAEAVKRAQRA